MSVAAHNNLEENLSLIEKTALRVKPILEEVMWRMVPENGFDINKFISENSGNTRKVEADMRIVLGYLN